MIYRVELFDDDGNSYGSRYFPSKAAAHKCAVKWRSEGATAGTPRAAETPKTKAEVIDLLHWWGGHAFPGGGGAR